MTTARAGVFALAWLLLAPLFLVPIIFATHAVLFQRLRTLSREPSTNALAP
jgi:hypothetical protein